MPQSLALPSELFPLASGVFFPPLVTQTGPFYSSSIVPPIPKIVALFFAFVNRNNDPLQYGMPLVFQGNVSWCRRWRIAPPSFFPTRPKAFLAAPPPLGSIEYTDSFLGPFLLLPLRPCQSQFPMVIYPPPFCATTIRAIPTPCRSFFSPVTPTGGRADLLCIFHTLYVRDALM